MQPLRRSRTRTDKFGSQKWWRWRKTEFGEYGAALELKMNPPKHTAGTSYHNLLENTRAELDIARAARNGARANWQSFIVSHLQTPVSSKHSSQELLLPAEKAIDAGVTFGPGATV